MKSSSGLSVQAIDSMLSTEFIRTTQFSAQPRLIAKIASQADSCSKLELSDGPADIPESTSLEDELTPLVLGLKRTEHLAAAVRLMRSAAAEEVKAGIR